MAIRQTSSNRPPAGGSRSDAESSIEQDDVFHLLQNERRRAVVRYFTAFDGPVGLGDLAEQVAAWECETPLEDVTDEQRQRVYIALYQSHLDKLDDHGAVVYDADEGTVDAGPFLDDLQAHLSPRSAADPTAAAPSAAGDGDPIWAGGYLGLALGGFVPVSGLALDVVPQSVVSLQAVTGVLLVACLVLATLHYRHGPDA